MPVVVDNNFSRDSYGIRLERLATIEANLTVIQAELSASADIVTWAESCFSDFSDLMTEKDVEASESEAATLDASMKGQTMEEEYQNAKTFLIYFLKDQPFRLKEFKLDVPFPDDRRMKVEKAEHLLEVNVRQNAEGVTPNLPPAIVTRLTDAITAYEAALDFQDVERNDMLYSSLKLSELYEKDTAMLQKLRSWWYVMMGKKDPRITLIGMVNPGTGGGGSHQLSAPVNLHYETNYYNVVWNAVENATSYSIETSTDGVNFTELATMDEPIFSYIPYDVHTYFKVRARNANGFGPYSNVMDFWYYEPLPAPSNFVAEMIVAHQYKLSWDLVHSVTSYKIYISDVAFGEPESVFTLFFETSSLEFTGLIPPGRRYYFKVTSLNSYQPESAFSNTEYVELNSVTP